MHALHALGFGPTFFAQLSPDELDLSRVARVRFAAHGHLQLIALTDGPDGPTPGERHAILAPRLRSYHDPVVVGDWVVWQPGDPPIVTRRLERSTSLCRRDPGTAEAGMAIQTVAANVDRVIVCVAADADLNVRRLERWMAVVADAGAEPALLWTKWDLGHAGLLDQARAAFPTLEVAACSAIDRTGWDEVLALIPPNRTAALVGASGAGKSTLVNWLLGDDVQATAEVRASDLRGRHATSARHLFLLPHGGWLLDNPGVRGIGPVSEGGVAAAFPDIDALASGCRFRDCHHGGEPGCAIQAALDEGALDPVRLAAWRKLLRELAFEARRADRGLAKAEREKWKRVHRDARARDRTRR